jgi:radical SAM protein with 4Fe4S-binding SPASM domain
MITPYMIDWAITNRCNLMCLHCRGVTDEGLNDKTILRIAREIPALKPEWVIIEGGEPLLSDELFEILGILHENNIKTYLISNGMLFNAEFAKRFAELTINLIISIDGADKNSYEKIRKGASFEKLKESVAIANEYGILDSCTITVGKHNYHQTGKLFEFVKGIGFKKITFLGLKPCKDYESYFLNSEEYEEFFFTVIKYQKDYGMDVYVDEPFFKPFLKKHNIDYSPGSWNGIMVPGTSRCILGKYMFIETNGDIKPCTFSPVATANAKERSLNEIWGNVQNTDLVKQVQDFSTRKGPCKGCSYLDECGGCRARTYILTGSWRKSDPSCPLKERMA